MSQRNNIIKMVLELHIPGVPLSLQATGKWKGFVRISRQYEFEKATKWKNKIDRTPVKVSYGRKPIFQKHPV